MKQRVAFVFVAASLANALSVSAAGPVRLEPVAGSPAPAVPSAVPAAPIPAAVQARLGSLLESLPLDPVQSVSQVIGQLAPTASAESRAAAALLIRGAAADIAPAAAQASPAMARWVRGVRASPELLRQVEQANAALPRDARSEDKPVPPGLGAERGRALAGAKRLSRALSAERGEPGEMRVLAPHDFDLSFDPALEEAAAAYRKERNPETIAKLVHLAGKRLRAQGVRARVSGAMLIVKPPRMSEAGARQPWLARLAAALDRRGMQVVFDAADILTGGARYLPLAKRVTLTWANLGSPHATAGARHELRHMHDEETLLPDIRLLGPKDGRPDPAATAELEAYLGVLGHSIDEFRAFVFQARAEVGEAAAEMRRLSRGAPSVEDALNVSGRLDDARATVDMARALIGYAAATLGEFVRFPERLTARLFEGSEKKRIYDMELSFKREPESRNNAVRSRRLWFRSGTLTGDRISSALAQARGVLGELGRARETLDGVEASMERTRREARGMVVKTVARQPIENMREGIRALQGVIETQKTLFPDDRASARESERLLLELGYAYLHRLGVAFRPTKIDGVDGLEILPRASGAREGHWLTRLAGGLNARRHAALVFQPSYLGGRAPMPEETASAPYVLLPWSSLTSAAPSPENLAVFVLQDHHATISEDHARVFEGETPRPSSAADPRRPPLTLVFGADPRHGVERHDTAEIHALGYGLRANLGLARRGLAKYLTSEDESLLLDVDRRLKAAGFAAAGARRRLAQDIPALEQALKTLDAESGPSAAERMVVGLRRSEGVAKRALDDLLQTVGFESDPVPAKRTEDYSRGVERMLAAFDDFDRARDLRARGVIAAREGRSGGRALRVSDELSVEFEAAQIEARYPSRESSAYDEASLVEGGDFQLDDSSFDPASVRPVVAYVLAGLREQSARVDLALGEIASLRARLRFHQSQARPAPKTL